MLRVAEIWRYPVKSMGGERLDAATVGLQGIRFDRGWAVRDEKAGAIRSARYIPRLLLCSARYLQGTDAGLVPHVDITLPDGDTVRSDDTQVNRRLSEAIGRDLTLWSLKPETEIEHLRLGPSSMETDSLSTELKMIFGLNDDEPPTDLSAFPPALLRELGELAAPRGTYFDAFPFDILATSSIRHMQRHLPDASLDPRRFRPNVLLDDDGDDDAPIEQSWIGRSVRIGEAMFDVMMGCPRCTIIAAEQQGGVAKDSRITRTIVREMKQILSVYCTIRTGGEIALTSTAEVIDRKRQPL